MKVLLNWPLIILVLSWKISSSAALSSRVFSARYPYRSVCASQGLFWNPTGLHWENTGIFIPFYFEIKHLLIRAKITQDKSVALKFIGFPLNHCHNFCLLILCQNKIFWWKLFYCKWAGSSRRHEAARRQTYRAVRGCSRGRKNLESM